MLTILVMSLISVFHIFISFAADNSERRSYGAKVVNSCFCARKQRRRYVFA